MKNRKRYKVAGDLRIAGTNYRNISVGTTFVELAVSAEEHADLRMIGCGYGEAEVTFEKMSQVSDVEAVARLAGRNVR